MTIISDNLGGILAVTGVITALPVVQFLAPRPALKLLNGITPADVGLDHADAAELSQSQTAEDYVERIGEKYALSDLLSPAQSAIE
jgi:hypothetical protein